MPRDLAHLFVQTSPVADPYRPHPRKMVFKHPPSPNNPRAHAARLSASLNDAATKGKERRDETDIAVDGAKPGLYIVFEGIEGFDLKLRGLDLQRSGIELLTVSGRGRSKRRALVFVPDGKVGHFLKQFHSYATEKTPKGQRKQKDLVERIADIRLATLRALWTDQAPFPGTKEAVWWEVWLRASDGHEMERLSEFAEQAGMSVGRGQLTFPDRIVSLVHGSAEQLAASLDVLNDLAEVRLAKEMPGEFVALAPSEQAEWVSDLLRRLRPAPPKAPAVCILDTGVNRGHPLLAGSLAAADMHTYDPAWRSHDHDGHGTEMAGLALLGDLSAPLLAGHEVHLGHRLESVKILPPAGDNDRALYGAIMVEGVSRVEVAARSGRARSELWLHDSDLPPPITTSSGGGRRPPTFAVERASPHAVSRDELALVTAPKKPKPADTTRADFVRARPEMSVANLLVAAKAAGIGLSSSYAFEIRAVDRQAGKTAGSSAKVSAPTTTTSASAVPTAIASKNRATKKSRRKRRAKSAIARIALASTPVASVKLAAPEAEPAERRVQQHRRPRRPRVQHRLCDTKERHDFVDARVVVVREERLADVARAVDRIESRELQYVPRESALPVHIDVLQSDVRRVKLASRCDARPAHAS